MMWITLKVRGRDDHHRKIPLSLSTLGSGVTGQGQLQNWILSFPKDTETKQIQAKTGAWTWIIWFRWDFATLQLSNTYTVLDVYLRWSGAICVVMASYVAALMKV